jgi:hypothetical protein
MAVDALKNPEFALSQFPTQHVTAVVVGALPPVAVMATIAAPGCDPQRHTEPPRWMPSLDTLTLVKVVGVGGGEILERPRQWLIAHRLKLMASVCAAFGVTPGSQAITKLA